MVADPTRPQRTSASPVPVLVLAMASLLLIAAYGWRNERRLEVDAHRDAVYAALQQADAARLRKALPAATAAVRLVAVTEAARIGDDVLLRVALASNPPRASLDRALRVAAQSGYEDVCATLLDAGANPRGTGWPPLCVAAVGGHVGVMRLLLSRGAPPDDAVWIGGPQGRTLIVAQHAGMTPLMEACASGHTAAVRELLRRGADVDRKSAKGYTPLFLARHGLPPVQVHVAATADTAASRAVEMAARDNRDVDRAAVAAMLVRARARE